MARRLIPPLSDVALAAGIAALAVLELWLNRGIQPRAAAAATELMATVALAWRRQLPLATTALVGVSFALEGILGVPVNQPLTPVLAIIVAVYSIAAHTGLELAIIGGSLMAVASTVASQDEGLTNVVFGLILIGGAWAVGRVVRSRMATASQLQGKAKRLEEERLEQERYAATAERARIAAELHDVISHSVSIMVVQADAAAEVLRRDSERALEPLRSIQATGRQALAELGHLLGVLRSHGEEIGFVPQPRITDVGKPSAGNEPVEFQAQLQVQKQQRALLPGMRRSIRGLQEAMAHRLRPPLSDIALAAGVAGLAVLEVWLNSGIEPKAAAAPTELVAALALAWRRRLPLATTALVAVSLGLENVLGVPVNQPVIPVLAVVISVYSVAEHAGVEKALAGAALMLVAGVVGTQSASWTNLVFLAALIAGALVVGWVVRSRTATETQLERKTQRLEREREEQAHLTAAKERVRIARDLHDVISHSVSVMVVQAGAAEEVLRRNPGRALEVLGSIQSTGREALAELSRLLGVLWEHGEEVSLAPQPGIADLSELLAQSERAGFPVELRLEGRQRQLPPGMELSLYRVVQEALTNTRKHAGRVLATVLLHYGDEEIVAEISDDGATMHNGAGSGLGLVGMRERIALYGGSLEAGRRPEGGYIVRVRIPLEAG